MTELRDGAGFAIRSQEIAANFIQSVVIFDDLAWMAPQPEEPVGTLISPSYGRPPRPSLDDENAASRGGSGDPGSGVPLDAKVVIDRFAELGAVCAVLQPSRHESSNERVAKAAERSDIVVLDWKIADSYGDVTIELMRDILRSDEDSERMRLFAIYTGEPGLSDIASRISSAIDEFYDGKQLIAADPFRVSKGPVTVVILAKEGTIGESNAILHNQEVSETGLADRLLDEFARMTQGLIRNVALTGLTNLRGQVYRILSKFHDSLDAGYLGHRLLLVNPPDAQDHVVEALGAEILSVLEDVQPGQQAAIEAIREWIRSEAGAELNIRESLESFWTGGNTMDRLFKLLEQGRDGVERCYRPSNREWDRLSEHATEVFTEARDDATSANRKFAALLGQKTRYGRSEPLLTLGTIIRQPKNESDDIEFFLCLQPKCDSIRLKSVTAFPLLPLEERSENQGFNLVVEEAGTRNWVCLGYSPKPNRLRITSFDPGEYPPGEVRACRRQDGLYFRDTSGSEYMWVADVKDEHALAVAVMVGNSLSRPGPNYAEWHRRAMR